MLEDVETKFILKKGKVYKRYQTYSLTLTFCFFSEKQNVKSCQVRQLISDAQERLAASLLPLSHVLELVWGNRDSINTSVFMDSLKDLLVTFQALQHILHSVKTQTNKFF